MPHRRGERDFARPEPSPGGEQRVAFTEVETTRADVAGLRRAFAHDDMGAVALGVLLDDDGIGAVGHRRAGEDAHRLALADAAGEGMARGGLADDCEPRRKLPHVGCLHGIAVHGRGVERRLRDERPQRLGQHATVRLLDGYALRLGRLDALEDAGQRLFDRQQGHGDQRPLLSAAR